MTKTAVRPTVEATIRFKATLSQDGVAVPRSASAKFGSAQSTVVEGTIEGYPFRAALARHAGAFAIEIGAALRKAARVAVGATVALEITRIGDEPEVRVPDDLRKALAAVPEAQAMWSEITPLARREWVLWLANCKQEETRAGRLDKACDMLSHGKKRVCCFGGLNWLTKDAPTVDTWRPLPKAR